MKHAIRIGALALFGGALLLIIIIFLLMSLAGSQKQQAEAKTEQSFKQLSDAVEEYRDTVTDIAKELELEQYVNNILAIMECSTQGKGTDVMNAGAFESNEKYSKFRGGIADPTYSIRCGMTEFKKLLELVGVKDKNDKDKLLIVYQAYQWERSYVNFANAQGGYTKECNEAYIKQRPVYENGNLTFANDVEYLIDKLGSGGSGQFIFPLEKYHDISSPFGTRVDPASRLEKFHNGTDFPAPKGTPIMAADDGVVKKAEFAHNSGYGNHVKIEHSAKYQTLYAHMSAIADDISVGKTVKRGDVIGYVGSTGYSTGNHLHFSVFFEGEAVNPMDFLKENTE